MKYTFSCSDIGMSCDFKTENESKEQLMTQITEHAKSAHQMDPMQEEIRNKTEQAIKEEQEAEQQENVQQEPSESQQ